MSNNSLIRSDKTYKITDLPEIIETAFEHNGITGFTGSILRRPIPNTLNVFWHYAIFYGFDNNGVMWLIENNRKGIECVTWRDFIISERNWEVYHVERNSIKIKDILKRAREKHSWPYEPRGNNCEHFVNYCVFGEHSSEQSKNVELGVDAFISFLEVFYALRTNKEMFSVVINSIENIRVGLDIPRKKDLQELIELKMQGKPVSPDNIHYSIAKAINQVEQ